MKINNFKLVCTVLVTTLASTLLVSCSSNEDKKTDTTIEVTTPPTATATETTTPSATPVPDYITTDKTIANDNMEFTDFDADYENTTINTGDESINARLTEIFKYYDLMYDGNCLTELKINPELLYAKDINGKEVDYYNIEYPNTYLNQEDFINHLKGLFSSNIVDDLLHTSDFRLLEDNTLVQILVGDPQEYDGTFVKTFETLSVSDDTIVINCIDWWLGDSADNRDAQFANYIDGKKCLLYAIPKEFTFVKSGDTWILDSIKE